MQSASSDIFFLRKESVFVLFQMFCSNDLSSQSKTNLQEKSDVRIRIRNTIRQENYLNFFPFFDRRFLSIICECRFVISFHKFSKSVVSFFSRWPSNVFSLQKLVDSKKSILNQNNKVNFTRSLLSVCNSAILFRQIYSPIQNKVQYRTKFLIRHTVC